MQAAGKREHGCERDVSVTHADREIETARSFKRGAAVVCDDKGGGDRLASYLRGLLHSELRPNASLSC
jgi:hypothetical protein